MKKKLLVGCLSFLIGAGVLASEPYLSNEKKIEILKLQRDVNYKAALLQQKMQEVNALKEEFDKINLELQSKIKELSVQGYTLDFVNLEYKKNAENTKK